MDGGSNPPSSTPHILEPYPDVTPVVHTPVVTNSISIEALSTLLFADGPVFVSVHLDVRFIDRR